MSHFRQKIYKMLGIKSTELRLIIAAEDGDIEALLEVISLGADINSTPSDGFTAVSSAACFGHLSCVKELIAAGADVNKSNARNKRGKTALMLAVFSGNTHCLKVLTDSGADLNARCDAGKTAILYAAEYGENDCLVMLAQEGADVECLRGEYAKEYALVKSISEQLMIKAMVVKNCTQVRRDSESGIGL